MGVKGLTTFVQSRKTLLLEQYELHGGYVVIDGESVAIELYKSSKRPSSNKAYCNCAFGGDYNVYIRRVKTFFDNLEKCKVTALVIMDGAWEDKKMKTLSNRAEDKLFTAMNYTPSQNSQKMFVPTNIIMVFTTYLLQRQTKIVRCIFENDPCIAGVAKILNCPVVSSDSDFYIFGVKFISYATIACYAKKINNKEHALPCSIFKVENLLRVFPGLDHSVLPLLAILLGNDYIEAKIFKNFFNNLENQHHFENPHKLENQCNSKKQEDLIRKIDIILAWLSKQKLNVAVAAILSTLPVEHRQKVLDSIEFIVNGYLVLPLDMLEPLGFACEYPREKLAMFQQKRFIFQGSICSLEARHYWREYKINCIPNLGDVTTELPFGLQSNLGNESTTFADTLPLWFREVYKNAKLPSFCINMMFHRLFVSKVQIEDSSKPSAAAISMNLVRVIDGLLVAGRKEALRDLTYVIREGTSLVAHKMPTVCGINSIDFPALSELAYKPLSLRKRIFDETLEISGKESLMKDIPSKWRLYIATALYWIDPIDGTPPNACHIYALLFTMLLGVVEEKCCKFIALKNSQTAAMKIKKAAKKIEKAQRIDQNGVKNVKQRRNTWRKDKTKIGRTESIIEALEDVTDRDCLLAVSFFLNNCATDKIQSFSNSHDFDVTIVHAFAQFQSCLKHAIHLNALLKYPYKSPVVEKLFNGTILYNLYIQFEKHLDVKSYISHLLDKTPSLLRLLHLLIDQMKMLVHKPIANGYRSTNFARENSKTKKKKKTDIDYESGEMLYENEPCSAHEQCDGPDEWIFDNQKIYSLKAKKFLSSDCVFGVYMSRGVTKRKNKKKRSTKLSNNYDMSDDVTLQEKSFARRRLPKRCGRFRDSDITQSSD